MLAADRRGHVGANDATIMATLPRENPENAGDVPVYEPGWSRHPIAAWLVEHGGRRLDLGQLLEGLCERLAAAGVPLRRVNIGVASPHPEIMGRNVLWERGGAGIVQVDRRYGIQTSPFYLASPVKLLREGAGAIRRRLTGPGVVRDFPVLDDLIAIGCTDYVIMPIRRTQGRVDFVSWTTDAPDGFTNAQLTLLYDLLPLLSLRVELETAYEATATLLTTYLGREPAKRVLAGKVRRGQVETIRAAIWVSDLRGFTALSDRLPPEQLIELLDSYFETVARPIEAGGGEILKFIGDGLLSIFPARDDPRAACRAALAVAREVQDLLARMNLDRADQRIPGIACGIGLHLGDVQFGNIGARDRLDFTVVGRAVNEVTRVESLCRVLSRPILATAPFAEALGREGLVSVGFHALRGVREPREIFGLAG
jgi:adenylate cyclase